MGALCGALSGACAAVHVISSHSKHATTAEQSMGSMRLMQQHSVRLLAVVHVAVKPKRHEVIPEQRKVCCSNHRQGLV